MNLFKFKKDDYKNCVEIYKIYPTLNSEKKIKCRSLWIVDLKLVIFDG